LATAEVTTPPTTENLYEGMFLVESTRFANDPEKVTNAILELIQKAGGTVMAHRPWQDGKLAYPINGRRKGLHYLTYFKMPPSGMTDFERACKLSDTVMRKLVIRHDEMLFEAMVQAVTAPAAEAAPTEETKE
jgi:small subunit ribosomal protein S6